MGTYLSRIVEYPSTATISRDYAIRVALVAITVVYLAILFFYRLESYPTPFFDEGAYLHVAENFAENGIYADFSSEGLRFEGPIYSLGPTVILPIAWLYSVFGVSLVAGRLVMAVYGILMIVTTYKLGSVLKNQRMGIAAAAIVVLSYGVNLQYFSRSVSGLIPALVFLFAGMWLWFRPGKRRISTLIMVGILFGVAAITKTQYALFILPAVLGAWILEIAWYRKRGNLYFIIPGAVAGALFFSWTYYTYFVLGAGVRDIASEMESLRFITLKGFVVLDRDTLTNNFFFILGAQSHVGLFIPACITGLLLSIRRSEASQHWSILSLMVYLAAAQFMISVGWPRNAVPALVLAAFLVAELIYRVTDGYRVQWRRIRQMIDESNLSVEALIQIMLIGILVIGMVLPAVAQLAVAGVIGNDDAYRVADYVQATIPETALIETWEQELAVLTDHTIHYPPQRVQGWYVASGYEHVHVTDFYDFREHVDADYVVRGPFGTQTQVYPSMLLGDYELVQTIGDYEIFKQVEG